MRHLTLRGIFASALASLPGAGHGHEAWLLTPDEVIALSRAPVPELFTSTFVMSAVAVTAVVAMAAAFVVDGRLRGEEARLFAPLARHAGQVGPLLVRLGLAVMLALAAVGGLPRSGTALWAEPVLFVPDMQLALVPWWSWLAPVQAVLAVMLLAGVLTRVAAGCVIALGFLGLWVFGSGFAPYTAHFTAPALVLVAFGGGLLSVDRLLLGVGSAMHVRTLWPLVLALTGGTFAWLAVSVKLTQPTLLIAILKHGEVPLLGLPVEVAALGMAWVELVAGVLLALGVFVRPVAAFLIFAFTFFAVTIGETPLFHANLYGLAAMLLLTGRAAPSMSRGGHGRWVTAGWEGAR